MKPKKRLIVLVFVPQTPLTKTRLTRPITVATQTTNINLLKEKREQPSLSKKEIKGCSHAYYYSVIHPRSRNMPVAPFNERILDFVVSAQSNDFRLTPYLKPGA